MAGHAALGLFFCALHGFLAEGENRFATRVVLVGVGVAVAINAAACLAHAFPCFGVEGIVKFGSHVFMALAADFLCRCRRGRLQKASSRSGQEHCSDGCEGQQPSSVNP